MKKGRQEGGVMTGYVDRTGKNLDFDDLLVVLMVMKRVERKLLTLSRERERYGTTSLSDDSRLKKQEVIFVLSTYTVKKKFSVLSVPNRDVTNQTLSGRD
jgi:hypothetical protein